MLTATAATIVALFLGAPLSQSTTSAVVTSHGRTIVTTTTLTTYAAPAASKGSKQ